ncbi:MAG TPA: GTP 3',8-cyclase MoaA [Acidobacteriota bacterium]|nr:GTP 3',8-cyclase MoaA [Acidobacteriota bacterium]
MERLVDQFGRIATDLRISVTDRCNYRCVYCMPTHVEWLPKAQILTFDEVEFLARLFVRLGVNQIRLTGGEPLVRRDVHLLAARIAKIEGLEDLSITTNGYHLKELARPLKDAGITRLNVSLDTLRADRFAEITRNDSFSRVMAGIDAARDAGFDPIKINCVAIRGFNDDEIADFLRWGRDNRLQIRFIEFMPLDGDHNWNRNRVLTRDEILDKAREAGEIQEIFEHQPAPATKYSFASGDGQFGVIPSVSHPFCENCTRIRITAEGKFRNCLFAIQETDLRGPLRAGGGEEELERLIRATVFEKWAGHKINQPDFLQPKRAMYAIGG